jgi:hypothetical protein
MSRRFRALLSVVAITVACFVALIGSGTTSANAKPKAARTEVCQTYTVAFLDEDANPGNYRHKPGVQCFGSYADFHDFITRFVNQGGHWFGTGYDTCCSEGGDRVAFLDGRNNAGCGNIDYRIDLMPDGWNDRLSEFRTEQTACTNWKFYDGSSLGNPNYAGNTLPEPNGNPNAHLLTTSEPCLIYFQTFTSLDNQVSSISFNNNANPAC